MAFTNNFRIERIYFEKLKSNIDILKSYIEAGATGEALELLKNSVDVDGAVLLLYRNLGEAWAELADLIQKTQKELKDLDEKTEAYHDELNERIDEVNNYLMAVIRELDARLQIVEEDLRIMQRVKILEMNEDRYLYYNNEKLLFDALVSFIEFPHEIILKDGRNYFYLESYSNNYTTIIFQRLLDASATTGSIIKRICFIEAKNDYCYWTKQTNTYLGTLYGELSLTSADGGTCSLTRSQIYSAFNTGRNVILSGTLDSIDVELYVVNVYKVDNQGTNLYYVRAVGLDPTTGSIFINVIMPFGIDSDKTFVLLNSFNILSISDDLSYSVNGLLSVDNHLIPRHKTIVFALESGVYTMSCDGSPITYGEIVSFLNSGYIITGYFNRETGITGVTEILLFTVNRYTNDTQNFSMDWILFTTFVGTHTTARFKVSPSQIDFSEQTYSDINDL